MKKILLTGGTGLVGTDIRQILLKSGYQIIAFSRNKQSDRSNLKWIRADLSVSNKNLFKMINNVDIVIHAAASLSPTPETEIQKYLSLNMNFSEQLFRWCSSVRKKLTVIYFSSFSFLKKPLLKTITEEHPICPLTPYGISKYWGELALFQYAKQGTYRPLVFRLSSPISFNFKLLHDTVVKKWILNGQAGKTIQVIGAGRRTQDFVSTQDIARAVTQAIKNFNANGIYNIASGAPLSMTKLAKIISQKFKIKTAHFLQDERSSELWNISVAKAKKDFGYKPSYRSEEVIDKLLKIIT